MSGLSDTDWATLAVAFTAVVAALVLNPRVLRIGTLQRRKWLSVLIRVSPAIRAFHGKMIPPSNTGRALFLSGAAVVMVTSVLVQTLVTSSYEIPYAIYGYWFIANLVAQFSNRLAIRGLSEAFKDPSVSPRVVKDHHWKAPSAILRGWIVMLISDLFSLLLVVVNLSAFSSPSSWIFVGIMVVFGPLYLFQQIDLQSIVENTLFRSQSGEGASNIQVAVSVSGSVGDISGTIRGALVGIGTACQVKRDDGYIEEVEWGMIWRLGAKP